MRTKHELNQAFRDLHRDSDEPLMSRDEVVALLAANPVRSAAHVEATRTPALKHSARMPWFVGGSLAFAATIALIMINTSDETTKPSDVATRPSTQNEDVASSDAGGSQTDRMYGSGSDAGASSDAGSSSADGLGSADGSGSPDGSGSADGSASDVTTAKATQQQIRSNDDEVLADVKSPAPKGDGLASLGTATETSTPRSSTPSNLTKPAPQSRSLATQTVQLSADMLAPFGLNYERGSITYVEDGVRVTIRSNGVAARNTKNENNHLESEAAVAPLMVVVYHDEKHFSSWWDRTQRELPEISNLRSMAIQPSVSHVNGLIAVRVALPVADVLANAVDVVLWFPGTREVAERLPATYRDDILSELGISQTTSETHYTLPDKVRTSLVAESLVFPNPLRSGMAMIRLRMKQVVKSTGIVYDMFGKEIAVVWQDQTMEEGQTDMTLFGLDNAPTGVYNVVVSFEGSQERLVQRLMIQR